VIEIARADLRRICDHAEAVYPEECCGLLVGEVRSDGTVAIGSVEPSRNLAEDRRRRFEVDTRLRLDLQRRLRTGTARIVGLYHSHPDKSAQPSRHDLDMAWEPDMVWLIVAVERGQAIQVSGHRPAADGSRFEPLAAITLDR